jgi:hypothetical protein
MQPMTIRHTEYAKHLQDSASRAAHSARYDLLTIVDEKCEAEDEFETRLRCAVGWQDWASDDARAARILMGLE